MPAYRQCAVQWSLSLFSALLVAASSGMLGCAENSSPTSQSPGDPLYLVFSPQATPGTAKPASLAAAVSKIIGPQGGKLVAWGEAGAKIKATLSIPQDALAEETDIAMSVQGSRLSELAIGFAPAGLVFLQPARLKLKLDAELVDVPLAELKAYHLYADGTTGEATLLYVKGSGEGQVRIAVEIPGFSTYGLRGSD
jgi:hypothetical protein